MSPSLRGWRRVAVLGGTVVLLMIMAGFAFATVTSSSGLGYGGYGGGCFGGYGGYGGYGGGCPPPPPCTGGYGGYGGYGSCGPGPSACQPGDGSVITNGTVQMGVCKLGDLNLPGAGPPSSGTGTTTVGLRYLPTGADAISPGCPCEGWGAADATSRATGFADQSTGTGGLTPLSFSSTSSTAISKVAIGSTLEVTQDYHPSDSTRNLFEDTVTIKNVSSSPVEPLYRRVMDWDVEPTAFNEFVTIDQGSAKDLLFSSDNGFANANPLSPRSSLLFTGSAVDSGPSDHGAFFDFGFAALQPGESRTFAIYYGAAGTETEALSAVNAVGAEAYSLGQPNTPDGPTLGKPNTFIFAFTGIGGSKVTTPLTLDPANSTKTVGETQHEVATLRDAGGNPLAGKTLRYTIDGANAASQQSVTTNASGQAAIEWQGAKPGTDNLTVFGDLNGNGTRDSDEPQAYASVNWDSVEVVSDPTTGTVLGAGGSSVPVTHYTNPDTGLDYFTVPYSAAASAPGGCLQIPLTFTINPGGGSVSNADLILRKRDGTQQLIPLTQTSGTNQWHGTISCAYTATMEVEYDLTENGTTQHINVPVGGIVLIDPSGTVYDAHAAALKQCGGTSEADAIKATAVAGATVTLQRSSGGSFSNVLSGDPAIAPNVNPETTNSAGRFQWDVGNGTYRVTVSKSGYTTTSSRSVTIPPAVTDLNVGIVKDGESATVDCNPPSDNGNGTDTGTTTTPAAAPAGTPTVTPPASGGPQPPVTGTTVKCKVPKLAKKQLKQAAKLLKAAHCALGKVVRKNAKAKKNTILKTTPAAGKTLKAGTKIALVVSKGPKKK